MRIAAPLLLVGLTLPGCELIESVASLPAGQISVFAHPCFGNRTDTVHVDAGDEATIWVGCGTTTEGEGLYRSKDTGRTWEAVDGFESFRVNHVYRATNGTLYASGTGPNSQRVVSVATDDAITVELEAGGQVWNSFQVGTFLRLDDGRAVAESLTGYDTVFRPSDTAQWVDAYGWWTGEDSYQILDMVLHRGRIVGVGSTITQPPTVFVQTDLAGGLEMTDLVLGDSDGELWSVSSDGNALIAGGVDQIADVGTIHWTRGGDPALAESWESTDLSDLLDDPSWIRGVCRSGDHLVAVGELSQFSLGILFESTDGGTTWSETELPTETPPLSRCTFEDDLLVMVGAQGWTGIRPL